MRLLYPCDPFDKKKVDEAYEEEYEAAKRNGVLCSLFSAEDFEIGEFRPRPTLVEGEDVVYRGWMLKPDQYRNLESAVAQMGGITLTTAAQYRHCHYLPEWYSLCEEFTPKTIFLNKDDDFPKALAGNDWTAYFVKDFVKSLTTTRGSVAKNVEEIGEVVALIQKYRGEIEGGVCVREFEELRSDTEERYFVFRGTAFSRDDVVPEIVKRIAERIESPFFSVDIVLKIDGSPRLIELGDGQVSDRKKWDADRFIEIFNQK